jgi:hypothetical protein
MKEKSYVYKFNLIPANILSIIILIILGFITLVLINVLNTPTRGINIFFFVIVMIYLCVHELLHGLGYVLGGAKIKNIYYGVALEKGIICCLCRQEISKKNILISLQMPFVVIGIITYIIGFIIADNNLILLSICNLVGASMDLVMFFYILRIKNVRYSETDANDEFVLISKEDLTKRKSIFFNIKEVKDYKKEDYKFKKKKRVEVTKSSIIILIFMIGLFLLTLLPLLFLNNIR